MGAIDPLLGIVEMKNATGLVLASGEIPVLLLAGGRSKLTMPALSATMMDHLVSDLLSAEQRAMLRDSGTLETVHKSKTHGTFSILAHAEADKYKFTITRGARPGAGAAPESTPHTASAQPASVAITAPVNTFVTHSHEAQGIAPVAQHAASAAAPGLIASTPIAEASGELAALFFAVLEQAVARGASDVLFSADAVPLLRVDGEWLECHGVIATTADAIRAFFEPRVPPGRRPHLEERGSVDFAIVQGDRASGIEPQRFRVNLFHHAAGVSAALRPIWTEVPGLADLHLPPSLSRLIELRHGLVLVTGATGSGKSTTLAALIEQVNRTRSAHIVTLEDPIEYAYRRRRSVVHQREVGQHVDSFASGLRAALRENPDVLLVGEMRDAETIRLALTAAQTGHLVLSTLHSGSAVIAVERVLDAFSESEKVSVRQEVATTLRYVVAQQLVPAAAGGRVPALEVMTVNHAVAAQIREGRTHMLATQIEVGGDDGMVSMARALAELVRAGRVTRAVALEACDDREALERFLDERPAMRTRS